MRQYINKENKVINEEIFIISKNVKFGGITAKELINPSSSEVIFLKETEEGFVLGKCNIDEIEMEE